MNHKYGTSVVHKCGRTRFLDSLCIMHLMYVYIHENSEIKFLLFWTLTFDDLSRPLVTSSTDANDQLKDFSMVSPYPSRAGRSGEEDDLTKILGQKKSTTFRKVSWFFVPLKLT